MAERIISMSQCRLFHAISNNLLQGPEVRAGKEDTHCVKNSFVLYTDYMAQVELLTDAQAGVLFRAILCHVAGSELPEMDVVTRMAFSFVQSRLDRDMDQYLKTVEARREAGKQGGRPKANGLQSKQDKAKKANGFFEKQTKAKKPDNVLDLDNVLENENDKENIKDVCPEPEKSAPASQTAAAFVLNDGSMYNVTENDVVSYQQLYPGIDVMQQLRNITGWCESNPKNRKTRAGAKRFVNAWLSREQNRAPAHDTKANTSKPQNRFHNFDERATDYDSLVMEQFRRGK